MSKYKPDPTIERLIDLLGLDDDVKATVLTMCEYEYNNGYRDGMQSTTNVMREVFDAPKP